MNIAEAQALHMILGSDNCHYVNSYTLTYHIVTSYIISLYPLSSEEKHAHLQAPMLAMQCLCPIWILDYSDQDSFVYDGMGLAMYTCAPMCPIVYTLSNVVANLSNVCMMCAPMHIDIPELV